MSAEVILIEFGDDIFAQWCQKCNMVRPVLKYESELRCEECGWKMGEKLDSDYVKLLRENGQLN